MRIRCVYETPQSMRCLKSPIKLTRIQVLFVLVVFTGMYTYWWIFRQHDSANLVVSSNIDQVGLSRRRTNVLLGITKTVTPTFDSNILMAQTVKLSMLHSWKAYREYAWGKDEVEPVTRKGTEWMGASLTMIDSLDTLWIMGLTREFNEARRWIARHLRFDKNNDHISLFETTIRILGGLLSAYELSGDDLFLEKAKALGPLLLVAFDPQSTLPKPDVNFAKRIATYPSWSTQLSLSEISSIQLEFNHLSALIRDNQYAVKSGKVLKHLHSLPKRDGLLPNMINPTGIPSWNSRITLGARADSHYEYLLKVWIQTGKQIDALRQDYINAINGVQMRLVAYSKPNNLLFIGELQDGRKFEPKMDHLVCFLPATLVLGYMNGMPKSHLTLAENLARTCFELYNQTETGLSAEIVHFSLQPNSRSDFYIKFADRHNLLRPETMESLFYLYRQTKNPKYQEWGRAIFNAFLKYCRLPGAGFTGIRDVKNKRSPRMNKMDSFWLSETLKYSFLLFNETAASLYPFDKWLFNTEGHLLRIIDNSLNPLAQVYRKLYLE